MLLLIKLVLDDPDGLARLNLNFGSNFLKTIRVNMLNLSCQKIATVCKLSQRRSISKRSSNVIIMSADLLCWGVFSIKHVHLDIESICSFHEHSPQLPTTKHTNLCRRQHRENGY